MKFLILNGSPKKDGHTSSLAKTFAKAAGAYGECEQIMLCEENIPPVTGELDVKLGVPSRVQDALMECDAFVVVTPVYWFNMPGVVKNLIDHLTILEDNDFMLEGKVAGCIVYSPEGGEVNVLQNLAMVFNHMGITVPPYCLIFDRGHGEKWVGEDIPMMARSLAQQVGAQKEMKFRWDVASAS